MILPVVRLALSYLALDSSVQPQLTEPARALAPSQADQKAYLDAHNNVRAKHDAVPLVWDNALSEKAASWARRCVFKHSGGTLGPYGENLAAGTRVGAAKAVDMWNSEEKDYNPGNPKPSHYTQVVWRGSKRVGCAAYECAPGTIFPPNAGKAVFHVCEYFPQGNVIGHFDENVHEKRKLKDMNGEFQVVLDEEGEGYVMQEVMDGIEGW